MESFPQTLMGRMFQSQEQSNPRTQCGQAGWRVDGFGYSRVLMGVSELIPHTICETRPSVLHYHPHPSTHYLPNTSQCGPKRLKQHIMDVQLLLDCCTTEWQKDWGKVEFSNYSTHCKSKLKILEPQLNRVPDKLFYALSVMSSYVFLRF